MDEDTTAIIVSIISCAGELLVLSSRYMGQFVLQESTIVKWSIQSSTQLLTNVIQKQNMCV